MSEKIMNRIGAPAEEQQGLMVFGCSLAGDSKAGGCPDSAAPMRELLTSDIVFRCEVELVATDVITSVREIFGIRLEKYFWWRRYFGGHRLTGPRRATA